ncbi:MAG: hypothetical protein ACPGXY_06210 [Alphaproteobacteria bacterium]
MKIIIGLFLAALLTFQAKASGIPLKIETEIPEFRLYIHMCVHSGEIKENKLDPEHSLSDLPFASNVMSKHIRARITGKVQEIPEANLRSSPMHVKEQIKPAMNMTHLFKLAVRHEDQEPKRAGDVLSENTQVVLELGETKISDIKKIRLAKIIAKKYLLEVYLSKGKMTKEFTWNG